MTDSQYRKNSIGMRCAYKKMGISEVLRLLLREKTQRLLISYLPSQILVAWTGKFVAWL